jgi:hypothetical protein
MNKVKITASPRRSERNEFFRLLVIDFLFLFVKKAQKLQCTATILAMCQEKTIAHPTTH